ncbi:alpha-ketoglutarate-dependent dioxygenase AlkB [Vibrio sp. CAU 1672]|uniref:alpha-ketoglutarate-dependent dioxygenase AlkB family protein n=1 Tax=Vibrio sp. CAU 1672 TaxID=3032594 RepID=UPI0023D9CAB4|nr:alpha-ketoglutarate-dependent dioxygenase AlkB [Vibrio sp. CAU 1672]MDF2152554.1 alpha-ketoglutarate-dependent dioxygenase AlkB [Vibrio sp. CAU 1672]
MQVQGDFFQSSNWQAITQGRLFYQTDFLPGHEADHLLDLLLHDLPWEQKAITLFGRSVLQPRLQSWHGDARYRYSGLTMEPHPWTPELKMLSQRCGAVCSTNFNSVLANLYRDGRDSMGWHQDNEPELGKNPVIASLSLGESRRFLLRHLRSQTQLEYELPHGSLLIMTGELQHHWQHSVPKTAKPKHARINLTFRNILTAG